MIEVEFRNVTITVPARNQKLAYAKLCKALSDIGADWITDTYAMYNASASGLVYTGPTTELFPELG